MILSCETNYFTSHKKKTCTWFEDKLQWRPRDTTYVSVIDKQKY